MTLIPPNSNLLGKVSCKPMNIKQLLDLMQGADYEYAEGVLRVTEDQEVRIERFWTAGDDAWRLDRSDGMCFISNARLGSATFHNGRMLDAGPKLHLSLLSADWLLRPRFARIWGRPGDDWQMLGEPKPLGPELCELQLVHADDPRTLGTLDIDQSTGRILVAQLSGRTSELLSCETDCRPDWDSLLPPFFGGNLGRSFSL